MPDKLKSVGNLLLDWYLEHKRDLPWRHTKDPYKIWISEIMLQQTRVDTVIEYYNRFIRQFENIRELAEAPEHEVLAIWKGLGYYSRARNLQEAAKQIVEQHNGVFPEAYEAVKRLPGIGDYTAGAVLSIAFNRPYPAVDGNVLRVVSRIKELEEDISRDKTKKTIAEIVRQMIPDGNAGDFTQALMELGALVCIPSAPRCEQCPIKDLCLANQSGRQGELPVREKKDKPSREIPCWAAIIRENGRILMEHRKDETLLGRMWGVPIVEKDGESMPERLLEGKYGLRLEKVKEIGSATHVFTHQVWRMEAVEFSLMGQAPTRLTLQWIDEGELENLAVPTAFQRVLKLLKRSGEWEQIHMDI